MRTFIAIEIPEGIKKEIVKIQEQLPEFKGKKTEFENLHLTLKFLGEIDEKKSEQIRERLKEIKYPQFEAEIDYLGFFDNSKSRNYSKEFITWMHIKNCDGLQRKIDSGLKDLFKLEKRFMSHLTIARIKNIKDKKRFLDELNQIKIPKMNFNIDSFYLMNSKLHETGPKYSVIEKYELKYK